MIKKFLLYKKGRTAITILRARSLLKKAFTTFVRTYRPERDFQLSWKDRRLYLEDATETTLLNPHYTYHPAWAARVLAQTKPKKHMDIGSILHFSAMASAWIPIEYYDYRPANLILPNLSSGRADLTALPFEDDSVESLSCMHTIEYVGLGRYGDPLDADGDLKAIAELQRVANPGGSILFVVPVGTPRIIFNAHRIYSYEQVLSYFNTQCILKDCFLIPDDAPTSGPIEHATAADVAKQTYGCGCFWFEKKSPNLS